MGICMDRNYALAAAKYDLENCRIFRTALEKAHGVEEAGALMKMLGIGGIDRETELEVFIAELEASDLRTTVCCDC